MKLENISSALKDFWNEYKLVKSGIIGIVFLLVFLIITLFEPYVSPDSNANNKWTNITYWDDNPSSVPPVWVDLFSSKNHARNIKLEPVSVNKTDQGQEFIFEYDYEYYYPPEDMYFHFDSKGGVNLTFKIERPDGISLPLFVKSFESTGIKHNRLSTVKNGKMKLFNFLKRNDRSARNVSVDMIRPSEIIFTKKSKEMHTNQEPLNGIYRFSVLFPELDSDNQVSNPYINVAGSVFGVMGTDSTKRDLWSGILAGVKWALLIGLLTAFISVTVGVTYGVSAAYFGGKTDIILMRIYEVFISTPILPFLIVLSAIFNPSIFIMIGIMAMFFWTGSVMTVRSMALQIKEEVYIEASQALGASHFRIIFKHIIPIIIPFAFSQMALMVPGAIIFESTISLLGLGDSSIVTWGTILRDANTSSAVISGQWWWIVPPGIGIACMGMTFAFVGFAMDKILNPRLRTR